MAQVRAATAIIAITEANIKILEKSIETGVAPSSLALPSLSQEDDFPFTWRMGKEKPDPRLFLDSFQESLGKVAQWVQSDLVASGGEVPTVFIAYDPRMEEKENVNRLVRDLTLSGLPFDHIFYDKGDSGAGSADVRSVPTSLDPISTADHIILIGSPELKTNYESRAITQENIGTVSHPIDAVRIREIERGEKGIIPILFSGSSHDAFPYSLKHLKVRVFNDESYFNSFFSLLKDINQLPSDSPLSAIRKEFMSFYK